MYRLFALAILLAITVSSDAAIITVGPGASAGLPARDYTEPCAAIAAALATVGTSPDEIRIDGADSSGNQIVYYDLNCQYSKSIKLVGVGVKRPAFDRTVGAAVGGAHGYIRPSDGHTTLENIEARNARCNDNCTPVWGESVNVDSITLTNVKFWDNDNGFLGFNHIVPSSQRWTDVTIEYSEFSQNGRGNGQTHNVYVGLIRNAVIRYNYIHDSDHGQLVKSRAGFSLIAHNLLMNSHPSGFSSSGGCSNYEIDLSSGGDAHVIGNIIYQSELTCPPASTAPNKHLVVYCTEDAQCATSLNEERRFYATHNTIVNNSDAASVFIRLYGSPTTVLIKNNILAGLGDPYWVTNTNTALPSGNLHSPTIAGAGFVGAAVLDFRLAVGSSALNAAVAQGTSLGGVVLDPVEQYVHPQSKVARSAVAGAMDYGAYEQTLGGPNFVDTVRAEIKEEESQVRVFYGSALVEGYASGVPVSVTGYEIYKNGALLATKAANVKEHVDTTGQVATGYTYTVRPIGTPNGALSAGVFGGSARPPAATPGTEIGWHYISNSNFATGCSANPNYWFQVAGAAFATATRKLWIYGGSPSVLNSNFLCAWWESDNAWHIEKASDTMGTGEFATTPATHPGSRSLYNGLTVHGATGDLFAFGGILNTNAHSARMWRYQPGPQTWSNANLGVSLALSVPSTAYHPTSGLIYFWVDNKLYTYNPTGDVFTQVASPAVFYGAPLFVDAPRNRVYHVGLSWVKYYDVSNGHAIVDVPSASCAGMKVRTYPSAAWDTDTHKLVYWDNGSTVIILDPVTNSCTSQTIVGAPLPERLAGNSLHYSPEHDGFWLVRNNANVAFLRLAATAPSGHTGGGLLIGGKVGNTP